MKIKVKRLNGFAKIKGLIGEKSAESIYFQTRFGIHTFGLRFPIDVLILDSQGTVVKTKKNMGRNRIFLWNPKFNTVIELPKGTIERKKIRIGAEINIDAETHSASLA